MTDSRLFILDTDTLSRFRFGDAPVVGRILRTRAEQIAITVITVEEQLNGWYIQLRKRQSDVQLAAVYDRIARTMAVLGQFRVLSFDETAIARYRELEAQRLNVGKMDLRIGAIALTHGATVITSNVRDFSRIPGLIWEDWASAG